MRKLLPTLLALLAFTAFGATNYTINVGVTANDGTGDPLRIAFGKVNTNFSSLLGTNMVLVIPSDAPTLSNTVSGARAGTTFKLGPGYFDVGSNHLRLPHGVNLVGEGQDACIIAGAGSIETNGCIVNPGSTSLVQNLTIVCANRSTYYQAGIGCAYYSGVPFTNATLRNIRVLGVSDAFYLNTNAPCSWQIFNPLADSGWDAGTVQASTATAHDTTVYGGRFKSDMLGVTQPNAVVQGSANGFLATAGRTRFIGTHFVFTNANHTRGIIAQGANATVILEGCVFEGAGTNTNFKVATSGGGVARVSGAGVQPFETSGSIQWSSDNLVLTNVIYQGGGISFLDEEQLNSPIYITPSGGLVVGGNFETTNQSLAIGTAGGGIKIKEGANATMGTGKLTSGAATVSTTAVLTNSRILVVSVCTANAAQGLSVSNIVSGTSFRVHSASGSDANRFDWFILNPAP